MESASTDGAGCEDEGLLRTCGVRRNFYNLMVLSTAFLFLFLAFITAQSFATPLLGHLGTISLLILYFFFTVGGAVAPYIARRLGGTTALIAAAATYAIFVAAFIYLITPVLLVAAAMVGFGGSVLWTAHGMFMTQISTDDNKGFYFSLFQGILSVQLIPGNLASYYLLNYNDDESDDTAGGTTTTTTEPPNPLENMAVGWSDQNSVLFVALAVCCSLGVLGLGCLRPPDPKMGTAIPVDDRSLRVQIRSTLAHVCTRRLAYLIPLFVFGGIQLVMWASWFPRQMHAKWIGLVMPVFGGAAFIGGFLIGPALDRYGFVFAIALAIVAAVGAFSCTWEGNRKLVAFCEQHAPTEAMPCESYGDYDLYFAAAFFYGVLDVTFHTLSGAICTQSFASSGNTVDAFAAKWAFFGVGAIIGFSLSSPLSVEDGKTSSESQLAAELGITGAALLLAIPTLVRFLLHPPEPKSGDATGPPRTEDVIPNPYMDGLLGWTSL